MERVLSTSFQILDFFFFLSLNVNNKTDKLCADCAGLYSVPKAAAASAHCA